MYHSDRLLEMEVFFSKLGRHDIRCSHKKLKNAQVEAVFFMSVVIGGTYTVTYYNQNTTLKISDASTPY